MTSQNLHSEGWRQGSVLHAELPTQVIVFDGARQRPEARKDVHGTWIVASQDCSLARAKVSSNTPAVELRQVLDDQPPENWGIHARKFLLDPDRRHYLVDDKPTNIVSPKLLGGIGTTNMLYTLSDERVLALKTWLGNRYDRPAVPPEFVEIARSIAKALSDSATSDGAKLVRETYMMFESLPAGTIEFSLFAVTADGADQKSVRRWLADSALSVPVELGVARDLDSGSAAEATLEIVESWYCADLSQITWAENPGPDGPY